MASVVYNCAKMGFLGSTTSTDNIVLASDTIKVALVTSTYTADIDAHTHFDNITNEVSSSGTGYTAGGATLSNKTITQDNTNDKGVFDNTADTAWAASTITARGAIIYKSTGTAGTSPLIAYIDFGSDKISSSGTFTISWSANGILTLA